MFTFLTVHYSLKKSQPPVDTEKAYAIPRLYIAKFSVLNSTLTKAKPLCTLDTSVNCCVLSNLSELPLTFFRGVFALQVKVDLDLPKFELLLRASKDFQMQAISSTTEGIPFDLFKSGISFPRKAVQRAELSSSIKSTSLRGISRSLSREEIPHDNYQTSYWWPS